MKSIKIIITLFSSVFYLHVAGQFTTKTEYLYLKLINSQQNRSLIKDNLKNATPVAYGLIDSETDAYSSYFYNDLANSYKIIEQKEYAFFYYLAQRCLFPNDSLSNVQINNFKELAYSINLDQNDLKKYWDRTMSQSIPTNFTDRIILLLELSTELHFKQLTQTIYNIGLILRNKSDKIPIWYQHWEFLTIIGANEKLKDKIIHPGENYSQPIFNVIEGKNINKVYKKAIKHYIKSDAKAYARELIVDYKAQDLSLFEKIDLVLKKVRLALK